MKKLLILTLLFAFIGIDISAQSWTPVNGRQRFNSGLGIPVRDTLSPNAADTSQMVIHPSDGVLYYRKNGWWIRASAPTDYVTIGTAQTITGAKIFNPTLTASGKMARSLLVRGLLTAAVDSDTLVGLDIQPVFNLNSKAGVQRRWLRVGGNYDDSSFSFIKLTNNGTGNNTGASIEWPFNQRIQATFSEGFRFYNRNGTDYWTATANTISWNIAPTLTSSVNNGEFNIKAENGTSSKIIHSVGGYHSFKVYTAPATFTEMVRINSSGLNLLNLSGSGTRMATISSTGLVGTAALPYTTGYIDSTFLPLSAGSGKPLTGTLFGTAINMNNNITANTFIKATGTASQIMLADGTVLDKTNIYTGDATFDTTGRVLTLPKVGGGSTSVIIPRGTSSGAEGITALSSSRTGNLVTVSGDNGSSTVFTIRDADSASLVKFSDTAAILAGRWLPNRSKDSIAVLRTLINTKGSGNGTVTSVATNTGSGITGGTITSSGTIAADTANVLSTKANVTASLLAYTTISRFLDSLTNVQARIQTKQPLGNYITFADSSIILAGRWLPNRTADSIATMRALANSKQPIGNYLTFADSTAILAGRWLPNRSADSIAAIRALANTKGVGTVTSVAASAGTGISISGSPITSSGTITITNTAPDQTVTLTGGTGISVSGTYPNFTVTNSSPSSGGTVTSVGLSAPTGFTVSGTPVTSSGTLGLSFASGYSLPTDASQTNWNTAFNKRLSSASLSSSQLTLTLADASTVTASVPTFNQNTTGTAASLSAVLASNLGGAGATNGILKANGSGVVSAVVASDITSLISGTYLPLTAGSSFPLSGSLRSTVVNEFIQNIASGTTRKFIEITNDGAQFYAGAGGSGASTIFTGGAAYGSIVGSGNNTEFGIGTNAIVRYSISGSGNHDFKSGTATFGGLINGTSASFTLNQNATTRVEVTNTDVTNVNSRSSFRATSGTVLGSLIAINGSGTFIGSESNHSAQIFTNGISRIIVAETGQTLIGVSPPSNNGIDALQVAGSGLFTKATFNGGSEEIKFIPTASGTYGSANFMRWYRADAATTRAFIGYGSGNDQRFQIATTESNGSVEFYSGAGTLALTISSNQAITASSSITAPSFIRSGGTSSQAMQADGSVLTLLATTYTPTMTGVANTTAITNGQATYTRIGNIVTVSGFMEVTYTSVETETVIGISLPVSSNFTSYDQLSGNGSIREDTFFPAQIEADATNDRATIRFYPFFGSGTARKVSFSFQYRII